MQNNTPCVYNYWDSSFSRLGFAVFWQCGPGIFLSFLPLQSVWEMSHLCSSSSLWFTKANPDWMSKYENKCLYYCFVRLTPEQNTRSQFFKKHFSWLLKMKADCQEEQRVWLLIWSGTITSHWGCEVLLKHTSWPSQAFCCVKAFTREYAGWSEFQIKINYSLMTNAD